MIAHRFATLMAALAVLPCLPGSWLTAELAGQTQPLKVFISVDMEGIGGIGTPSMTSASGKDYATGCNLMTAEVNAVVETIFTLGPAEILVNDSHGDMQNLLHTRLDQRVQPRFKGSSQQHRVEGGFLRPRFHWTIDWRGRRGPDRGGS